MILFPAIDLKAGACVRLLRGDMSRATVYGDDPPAQARSFAAAGAAWIHVVDLDGAFAGRSINRAAVAGIVAAVKEPVQLGGGIRDLAAIEGWLAAGVARVVLGTVAARDPKLVHEAARLFPGCVAVGIDARDGLVAVSGWAETSTIAVADLARRYAESGVAALIYTDIGRDGTLEGPDVDGTRALAASTGLPVIASGGVAGLDDLLRLRDAVPGLAGTIVGRALYDGRIDLAAALARLAAPSC